MENADTLIRFTSFARLGADEIAKLVEMAGQRRKFERGAAIQTEGEPCSALHLLHAGWTASSVTLTEGGRQILKVHLPGDLLGAPNLALTVAAESVHALGPVTVSVLPLAAFGRLFEESPRLSALLYLISQEERVMLADRLTSMGRNSAPGLLATLLLQVQERATRFAGGGDDTFHIPLTQSQLAELAGLAPVHLQRTIQKLRDEKLIIWRRGHVRILDAAGLRRLSGLPRRDLAKKLDWLPKGASASA